MYVLTAGVHHVDRCAYPFAAKAGEGDMCSVRRELGQLIIDAVRSRRELREVFAVNPDGPDGAALTAPIEHDGVPVRGEGRGAVEEPGVLENTVGVGAVRVDHPDVSF